jgi:hypothetical protein
MRQFPAGYIGYYDRRARLWVCYRRDSRGYQVGPCGYGPTKADAFEDCTELAKLLI